MPIEDKSASVRGYWQARIAADTKNVCKEIFGNGDFGHLKRDIAAMADDVDGLSSTAS
jgi:hypothetical protein